MNWLNKVILTICLAGLVYWGGANYLVVPLETESYQLLNELKVLRSQRVEINNRLTAKGGNITAFNDLQNKVHNVKLNIPPRQEITKLIEQLPLLAEKSEVTIQGVEYNPLEDVYLNYQLLEFVMPVIATYKNIRQFIYELEKMKTILMIYSLSLKQNKRNTDKLVLKLSISTYYRKP